MIPPQQSKPWQVSRQTWLRCQTITTIAAAVRADLEDAVAAAAKAAEDAKAAAGKGKD